MALFYQLSVFGSPRREIALTSCLHFFFCHPSLQVLLICFILRALLVRGHIFPVLVLCLSRLCLQLVDCLRRESSPAGACLTGDVLKSVPFLPQSFTLSCEGSAIYGSTSSLSYSPRAKRWYADGEGFLGALMSGYSIRLVSGVTMELRYKVPWGASCIFSS